MPARKQLRQGETLTAFAPGDVLQAAAGRALRDAGAV